MRIELLVLAVALAALAWQALRLDYTVDDAYTSFRYAKNMIDGHGLTYNPGGPRVEGYTNFLWVMLMAGAMAVGLDPLVAAKLLGIASGFAVLVLAWVMARKVASGIWPALAPALLAANPAVAVWSSGGLETMLFTALILLGTILALEPNVPRWAAGGALGLACLTRPEGIFAAALVLGGVVAARGVSAFRPLVPSMGALALFVIPHEAWRISYYGAWLPNTFYAKTGDLGAQIASGSVYVFQALTALAGGPLLLAVLALAVRHREARTVVSATVFVGWCLYALAIGGDGLPMYRFLVPVLPFLAVLVVSALAHAFAESPRAGFVAAAAATAWVFVAGTFGHEHDYVEWDRKTFLPKVTSVGKSLRSLVGERASIALLPAGAIPFYSGLTTIDMFALNDPVVARKTMPFVEVLPGHWKYDAAEVFRRRPDYFLLGNVDVTSKPRTEGFIRPAFRVEADLGAIPAFRSEYELVSFPLPTGSWLNCYRRIGGPPPPIEPHRRASVPRR